MNNSLKSIGYGIVIATSVAVALPAQAANFLYYSDFVLGTDQFQSALAASGNTYTVATDATNFLTLLQTNTYDVGAFFVQNNDAFNYTAAINGLGSFVASGGKAIYADWSRDSALAAQFGAGFTGNNNNNAVTILNPAFGPNQTLTSPGWGVFSTGLTALSGSTVAATFGNGDAAIVVGNGGRSIVYGFLNDTTSSPVVFAGGISQLAGGATAVPEPFTVIGSIIGGTAAFRMRTKLKSSNKA
jgi:hypothetical protein